MSPNLIGLVGSQITAAVVVSVALALNVRRSARLIRHVDWRRVSDPHGLVHYTRLIMLTMGPLISINGIVRYALPVGDALEKLSGFVLIALLIALAVAMMVLKRRFQDRPSRDEQR
jgi:hypothetical protein